MILLGELLILVAVGVIVALIVKSIDNHEG
jgi:hypothetical protein